MAHVCTICSKAYDRKANLNYHFAHHFDEKPFSCEFCRNAYKTKADLRQHQRSHEKQLGMIFVCDVCQASFDSSTKLNVHKRDEHSIRKWRPLIADSKSGYYTCDIDGKTFLNLHKLKRHVEAVHLELRPFPCDLCDKTFKTAAELKKHYLWKYRPKTKTVRRPRPVPDEIIDWGKDEEIDVKIIRYKCSSCSELFTSRDFLSEHEQKFHPNASLVCDFCSQRFETKVKILRHIKSIHKAGKLAYIVTNSKQFKCGVCSKILSSKRVLVRHKKSVHQRIYDFMCDKCSAKFADRGSLNQHVLSQHPDGFNCELCNKICVSIENLEKHVIACRLMRQSIHNQARILTTPKQVKCEICEKILATKNSYDRHMKAVHKRIYDFKCDRCSAKFRDRSDLNKHQKMHQREPSAKRKWFDCEMCHKSFALRHNLEKHEIDCRLKRQSILNQELETTSQIQEESDEEMFDNQDNFDSDSSSDLMPLNILKQELNKASQKEKAIEVEEIFIKQENFDSDPSSQLKPQNILKHELEKASPIIQETIHLEEIFIKPEIFKSDQSDSETFDFEESNEVNNESPEDDELPEIPQVADFNTITKEEEITCEQFEIIDERFETTNEQFEITAKEVPKEEKSTIKKSQLDKKPKRGNSKRKIKNGESDGEPENIQESEIERIFKGKTFSVFSKRFECKLCTKDFKKLQELKLHCVFDHRIKKFKCKKCNHSFPERGLVRQHLLEKHWEDSTDCFILRNYKIPNESAKCLQCSQIFVRKDSMKRHIEFMHSERPVFHCDKCGATFKDIRTVRIHVENHRADKQEKTRWKTNKKSWTCEFCGEILLGRMNYFAHRWKAHFNFEVRNSRYHCLICEQVCKTEISVKRHHVQVHQQGKLLVRPCRLCNLNFKLYDDFKAHIEDTKIHQHDHICSICGDGFKHRLELSKHEKSHRVIPEDEKKYECDFCGYKFQQKGPVLEHLIKKHGGPKNQYRATCEVCGESEWASSYEFYCHRQNHLAKKFKCSSCDKSFKKRRDLRDHEMAHTNRSKIFKCQYEGCSKEYEIYRSYRWHVVYTHEQNRTQCKTCSEVLPSQEKLIAHIDEHHPEERRFRCNRCGKTFKTQFTSTKHIKRCKKNLITFV